MKMVVGDSGDYHSNLYQNTKNASNKMISHPKYKNFKIFESKTGLRNSPLMFSVRDYDSSPIDKK